MEIKKWVVMIFLVGASIITMIGCKKNYAVQSAPIAQQEILLQNSTTLGTYLTDKQNHALYFFSNDADGQDSCTGGCQTMWPSFIVENLTADKLGAGLDISDFGSITSSTGARQVTYKGWPLYSYNPLQNGTNQPEAPGLTSGDGFANVWYVARPDYTIMLANAQLIGNDGRKYKSDLSEGIGRTLYFTDGSGHSIYTFSKDSSGKNKFTAPDFSNNPIWPIYETDKIVVPSSLSKTDFGSIQVFGKVELTYKGWPLHNFGQDGNTRGSNKGISFPLPGVWPIAVKDIRAAP